MLCLSIIKDNKYNMKIEIKEVDRLVGTFSLENTVSKYLIYLVDDNGQSVACEIAYGEDDKSGKIIKIMQLNSIELLEPIQTTTFEEWKTNNDLNQ